MIFKFQTIHGLSVEFEAEMDQDYNGKWYDSISILEILDEYGEDTFKNMSHEYIMFINQECHKIWEQYKDDAKKDFAIQQYERRKEYDENLW